MEQRNHCEISSSFLTRPYPYSHRRNNYCVICCCVHLRMQPGVKGLLVLGKSRKRMACGYPPNRPLNNIEGVASGGVAWGQLTSRPRPPSLPTRSSPDRSGMIARYTVAPPQPVNIPSYHRSVLGSPLLSYNKTLTAL